MTVVERFTNRSGIKIRYLDNNPDEPVGLPILFPPGLTDFADEYTEVLEFFAPRRVLVVEVRGRGGSEAPPTGYAVADHVRDLEAVLDEEGIDRFHLMTFSRGTSWGLDLALAQPERVATMAIGDYRAWEVDLPDAFGEQQMGTRFRGKQMVDRIQPHVLLQLARDSKQRDLWDALGTLPMPLLVARAEVDTFMVDDATIEKYRAARPDVEVITVPGAPHDLFRPERLFYPKAVAEFIARRAPGL